MKITESKHHKTVRSPNYNYRFHKGSGYFIRWGSSKKEDPEMSPSPEIADIEVTTICKGVGGKVCKHCYKSNTPVGNNMSLDTFKKVFDKITENRILTQIAFGADSNATSNPELFDMMWYCRNNGVIPNITVADISDETAAKLAEVCGAVAVSRYENKNICYDSIQKLHKHGLQQINIHCMISEETFNLTRETIRDKVKDSRLDPVKAIVMLSLKQKGRGKHYHKLSQNKFAYLVYQATSNNVGLGFDSCSAFKFLNTIKNHKDFDKIAEYVEPCESSLFSIFINWKGEAFPCSFAEGCVEWARGMDVVSCNSFIEDVWNHERMVAFRNSLLKTRESNSFSCRTCPLFEV